MTCAAVVVWASDGTRTSGSPPVEIARVPPVLPPRDSAPTHPHNKAMPMTPAYLIAAMSSPRPESGKHVPALDHEFRSQGVRKPPNPRGCEPHRTLRSPPLRP